MDRSQLTDCTVCQQSLKVGRHCVCGLSLNLRVRTVRNCADFRARVARRKGFHDKAKLAMKKAYGFKPFKTIAIALDYQLRYYQLRNLPDPDFTHRFRE
ncbi:hypothetical protein [Planctomycetes bacterium TBK1r]|uniref:Transposase n=1 Tax=Stieleria magnilauensis TaxID=2527963 RepID=A0ABX5XYL4_9BACT|nr:hypothetical protein TBK1r_48020 [Planctomycetes bacterium TBK1r]